MKQHLYRFVVFSTATGLLFYTASAEAYIGPGAGISLLGALWALIAAVVAALGFIVMWPIRKARKRRLVQKQAVTALRHPSAPDGASARNAVLDAMDETPEAPTR